MGSKMAEKGSQAKQVSRTIIDSFELIPTEIRVPVLVSLAQSSDEKVRAQTASALMRNFVRLPSELQDILPVMARDRSLDVREVLLDELRHSFSAVAPEVREDMIYSFSVDEVDGIRQGAAMLITENYFALPAAVRKLLVVLGNDKSDEVCKKVANLILEHIYVEAMGEPDLKRILEEHMGSIEQSLEFQIKLVDAKSGVPDLTILDDLDSLPEMLQNDMITAIKSAVANSRNPSVRLKVAEAMLDNFDKLPDECKRLVVKLSEDSSIKVRETLVLGMIEALDEMPDDARILAIENLSRNTICSKDARVRKDIATLVITNFRLLSGPARESLYKLCNDDSVDVRECIAQGMMANFNFITSTMREEMLGILAKDPDPVVRGAVASMVARNFKMVWTADTLFEALVDDKSDEVRRTLTRELGGNFLAIPKDVREVALKSLSKDRDEMVRRLAGSAIIENYQALSKKERGALKSLVRDTEGVMLSIIDDLSYPKRFDRVPRPVREELLRSFVKDKSSRVRSRAALLILDTFSILSKGNRDLIIKLAKDKDDEVRREVARGLEYNFSVVWGAKGVAKEALEALANDEDAFIRKKTADILLSHVDLLHEDGEAMALLVKLGKDATKEVAEEVAENLLQNIGHLPKHVREELLDYYVKGHKVKGLDLSRVMKCAVSSVYRNFAHFPDKGEKMLRLALRDESVEVREMVAKGLDDHFDDIPAKLREDISEALSADKEVGVKLAIIPTLIEEYASLKCADKLLRALSNDDKWDVREFLALELGVYLDRVPDNLAEELLLALAEDKNPNVRRAVVHTCARNFIVMEKSLQKKLKDFALDEDPKVRHELIVELGRNPGIPDDIQDAIKKMISN